MKATNLRSRFLLLGACTLLSVSAGAQSYYDDDIYFDESAAKKEAKKAAEKRAANSAATATYSVAATTYSGSDRNVDEYNRRGSYKPVKEQSADLGDNFSYTRRIEAFHNPDIVVASNDNDLIYYYNYANDELADVNGYSSPTTINIYVDNSDPWDNFWSPYYYPSAWSWAWRPAYYNPWWSYNYTWGYGPSWSWNWNWGPSWNWGWNWGPSWSWGWGWNHGWHHPHPAPWPSWNHRPGHMAGVGASGTPGRPLTNVTRPGTRPSGTHPVVTSSGRRPSGVSSSSTAASTGRRPGNTGSSYNPANATRPVNAESTATGRGGTRRASSTTTTTVNQSGSYGGVRTNYGSGTSTTSGRVNTGTTRTSTRSTSTSGSSGSAGTRSGYNSGSSSSVRTNSSSSRGSFNTGGSSSSGSRGSMGGGSSRSSGGGGGGGRSTGGRH